MSYTFSFEKLQIWQEAIGLSVVIYRMTGVWPSDEKFGLISQVRRSSNSIAANISEGSTRSTAAERKRYLQIAYGSLMETLSHLILANKLEFLSLDDLSNIRSDIERLANKMNAYRRSIQ